MNLVPYEVYDAWITLAKADSGMRAVPATEPQGTGLDLKAFQNLGYTGEWFVFAGFVVFMWFRLRREAEFARDAELGLVPEHDEEEATVTEATARAETTGDTTAETTADATAQAAAAGALRTPTTSPSGRSSRRTRWARSSWPSPRPSPPCTTR